MSQVVLENLNPTVLEKLQILAQRHNRSLEDEIKAILEQITRNEIVDKKSAFDQAWKKLTQHINVIV